MRRIGVLPAVADDAEWQTRSGRSIRGWAKIGWIIGRNLAIDTRWADGQCRRASPARGGIGRARARRDPGRWHFGLGAVAARATTTIPIVFKSASTQSAPASSPAWRGRAATPPVRGREVPKEAPKTGGGFLGAHKALQPSLDFAVSWPWQPVAFRVGSTRHPNCATPARSSGRRALSRALRMAVLILTASGAALRHRDLIITLAARHKLPAIYFERILRRRRRPEAFYGAGCGSTRFRQAAGYVDRILKGEKPRDLPVQAPPSSSWQLISRPPRRLDSRCRPRYSLEPIR